jgi:hypothetical protein
MQTQVWQQNKPTPRTLTFVFRSTHSSQLKVGLFLFCFFFTGDGCSKSVIPASVLTLFPPVGGDGGVTLAGPVAEPGDALDSPKE